MKNYRQWLNGAVALSVLVFGAMNLSSVGSRGQSHEAYDRLLSRQYQRIAALEANIGTYTHYLYFKNKAQDVIGAYDPRPLTLKGQTNTQFNRREMRVMRWDLERAMVGYEMRHNPEAVAGMHASFECRVRNTNINSRIDSRCKKAFETFKAQAEKSVEDARMMLAKINTQENISLTAPSDGVAPEIQSVDFASEPAALSPIVPMKPIMSETPKKEKAEKTVKEKEAPMVKKIQPVSKPRVIQEEKQPEPEKLMVSPEVAPQEVEVEKPFDPLDYVHPRIRAAKTGSQKTLDNQLPSGQALPKPQTKPAPEKPSEFIEGRASKVPEEQMTNGSAEEAYGIKPLSETKMPKSFNYLSTKQPQANNVMSTDEIQKRVAAHPRFLEARLEQAPQITASTILAAPEDTDIVAGVDRFVVPFTQGGSNITLAAQEEIARIGKTIQNTQYSHVRFIGHADKGGNADYNQSLSFERAAQVHDALENIIDYVDIKNTTIDGYGDTQPLRAFTPYDDRNRRVVVELIK